MRRYTAQKQFKKAAKPTTITDAVLLKKLQHAADLEKRQNEEESMNMVGTEVTYGTIIQVQSLIINCTVCTMLIHLKPIVHLVNTVHLSFRAVAQSSSCKTVQHGLFSQICRISVKKYTMYNVHLLALTQIT